MPLGCELKSMAVCSGIVFPVPMPMPMPHVSATLLERPIRRWARRLSLGGWRADPSTSRVSHPVDAGSGRAPPVSVVIPTYNRSAWLRAARNSVLAQDYPDLELVVVDDGSTDDTPIVLADYARRHPEERFRFVRQGNAGQAKALNRGNQLARGEILGYLSDDDLLAPGAVSRLVRELVTDPSAAVAYPEYLLIDEAGAVEDRVRPIEYSPVAALRLHDTIIGPGGLARRWALEAAGGWNPAYRWMVDFILWMGVGLAGRAIRVEEPLASWRKHSGSVTIQLSPDHAREHLAVAEHGLEMAGRPPLPPAMRAEALRNACLFGALFGGESSTWPQERFVPIDLHRKRISAWSAGFAPDADVDWDVAEQAAAACRELISLTVELTALRAARAGAGSRPSRSPSMDGDLVGMVAARRRLREIGVLADGKGAYVEGVAEREMRLGLLEAAVACGYDTDLGSSRFFIIDRWRAPLSDVELDGLMGLTIGGSYGELREAVDQRRRELESLQWVPDRA
jgi:Glycosyl transferase family 2